MSGCVEFIGRKTDKKRVAVVMSTQIEGSRRDNKVVN
jgi:hypothetical protein